MRCVVQRVKNAKVEIEGRVNGEIGVGLLVLLGVCDDDTDEDIRWMADKVINLRVFTDDNDKMNLSLQDVDGSLLVVSQFTLYGSCKKGRRPNFSAAGKPEFAKEMYEKLINICRQQISCVETGEFGADMQVSLLNDGPVTLIIDSKE